ncbi:zinc finger protein 717-like [Contarinia nasturtii]|uniref:zinc finger protein 717-like n=1 Tax=Contarinia nasturtii TaxID=265458 RepID=UPI0012D483E4|nr:zinc finger protein 717-like [Contarinia nasturtii]
MIMMLAAFEQQTKLSLDKIEMAFKRDGYLFDDEFKQFFMRTSYSRIGETYDVFKINSVIKNKINASADWNMLATVGSAMVSSTRSFDRNFIQQEINGPVEIIDTSDDEDRTESQVKFELFEALPALPELDGVDQFDDGNYTEITKKRFKCELCEYSNNQKKNLNVHMHTHTGERPYQCDICRKGFGRAEILQKHKVTHIEQIPFHCRGCFRGFSQETERDGHEKLCKRRRYECHICKKFVIAGITLLKRHMRKHNGEKPFRCEICMMRFTQKGNLKSHLETIHTRIKIKYVYDEFEISSIFEDASTPATDEYPNLFHTPSHDMNNSQRTTNDPFEIIDSSDEEDQPSKMERAIRYDGHDISHQSNDYVEFDDDGSYTEMSDMKSNLFDYQGDVSKDRYVDVGIRNEMENAMKAEEIELDDGTLIAAIDLHPAMKIMGQNTSTVTLSNESSNGGGAKKNSMTARSFGRPRKQAKSGSTLKSLRKKKPTSSNPMGTKKRFQCELCEYSSNRNWDFNIHTRTHTGERPHRCDTCHKEFTQPNHLKQHKVTHTKEFLFHCRGCFSGFSQKAVRDAHEKFCKMRCYECHICQKFVTVYKAKLKDHMRTHNGEKPFRCEICMKHFASKTNVKRHLDTIHIRINA